MAKAKESPARFARGMGVGLASLFTRHNPHRSVSDQWRPSANRQIGIRSRQSPDEERPTVATVLPAGCADHRPMPPLSERRRNGNPCNLMPMIAACLGILGASPATPTPPPTPPPPAETKSSPLTLECRTICQDQGAWQVEYRFRNAGPVGLILAPDEISSKVEGWVSNSRIAAHSLPRLSTITVAKGPSRSADREVIAATEEVKRCKERLAVSIWPDDPDGCDACPSSSPVNQTPSASPPTGGVIVNLAPGDSMRVRLRLEHHHVIHGDYDPLLGARSVELTLGTAVFRDVVPLDREQRLALPKGGLPEIPEDRRDTQRFLSAPDSLHLEAHIPGHQYYRFPERPVRYDTKMLLRFSYLIAEGTEGDCRLRFSQVRDTPVSWRSLSRGNLEQCLKVVGRWTKFERIIRTDPEATHVALEFGIVNDTYIGEMWIDDVSLEPLEVTQAGP